MEIRKLHYFGAMRTKVALKSTIVLKCPICIGTRTRSWCSSYLLSAATPLLMIKVQLFLSGMMYMLYAITSGEVIQTPALPVPLLRGDERFSAWFQPPGL